MIVEPGVVEADLAAGRLCCPGCEGPLARWGFARERQVRMLDGVRTVKPRRAYCQRCEATHVLLPAWAVPRRRDGAEVIGEALLDKAQGLGHRGIAARLARPPATVRGWLRRFDLSCFILFGRRVCLDRAFPPTEGVLSDTLDGHERSAKRHAAW